MNKHFIEVELRLSTIKLIFWWLLSIVMSFLFWQIALRASYGEIIFWLGLFVSIGISLCVVLGPIHIYRSLKNKPYIIFNQDGVHFDRHINPFKLPMLIPWSKIYGVSIEELRTNRWYNSKYVQIRGEQAVLENIIPWMLDHELDVIYDFLSDRVAHLGATANKSKHTDAA